MTPYIRPIIAITLLSASFCAGWAVNGWRYGEKIATIRQEQAQAQADFTAQARAKEQSLTKQLNKARNEATKRETILRADAGRARTQSDGLRDELAAIRRKLPSLAEQAVRQYADAASVVFGECTAEYTALAEVAGRIDSDRQTLMDAWPK